MPIPFLKADKYLERISIPSQVLSLVCGFAFVFLGFNEAPLNDAEPAPEAGVCLSMSGRGMPIGNPCWAFWV